MSMRERREARQQRKEAERAAWQQQYADICAAYHAKQAAMTPEDHARKADFWYGVRIGAGILAGVAVAKTINGAASAPQGWALATWANQNGVQL